MSVLNKTDISKRLLAFVDVQNTATTTEKMLGFVIDWHKFCRFLKEEKGFEKIFLYTGIEEGDQETAKEFDSLSQLEHCIVRSKLMKVYKKKDKTFTIECVNCGTENTKVIDMGYDKKGNCDVELTADALENAGKDKRYSIFSGDGDFEYLVRLLMEKDTHVTVVSHAKIYKRAGLPYGRYSTKLRNLVANNPEKLNFQEISNWKFKIKKDLSVKT